MVMPPRSQPVKRGSMRPPPRPTVSASRIGRSESPAESVASRSASRTRSPSVQPVAGSKRKERDFDQELGEETNINVVVRCRGRNDREVKENSGVVVSVNGLKGKDVELSMGPSALSNKTYQFDKVFSPAADQAIIFDDVVKPILNEMLTGYNCTIFAYGQTGTGKTYTMSGDMTDTLGLLSDAAGIIPRVLYTLFQKLESEEVECSVKCSFIELYNEDLRDLLSADDSNKLKIYDDNTKKGHGATMVQGMEESHIQSASAGVKLLQAGSHRRQVAATKCNDLSSRSHTVFTITTYLKKADENGEDFICAGKLNLVDLAGSENIQRSGAENKRAAEAGLINKSLLTLGRVINALVDKSSHIPYRESKLTRLLQDSLGGRTKTCIIATVSPAKSNLEETISTLDYAFRAKNIRNKPQVNSMVSKKTLLREFTCEIEKLKGELIATRQRNGVYLSNEQFEEITVESESRRILSEEQSARIETLEASLRNKVHDLFSLTNNFNGLKRDGEVTRLALEKTKDVLEKTELVLADTERQLSEETDLRRAHQTTEEELHVVGNELLAKLDESVHDIGGLHSKLRRKSDLHLLNRQAWESSTTQVAHITNVVDERVEVFRDEQLTMLTSLSEHMQQFQASEIQKVASSQESLKRRRVEYEDSERQVRQQSSAARDDMDQVLEGIKVLREEVKGRIGEGLNGLSLAAARISRDVIAELEQFHTQLHLSYSALGRDFKSVFEDVVKHVGSQREEIDELRRQLQEANKKIVESNTEATQSLEACLKDEQQATHRENDLLLAQIKALMEGSAKQKEIRLHSNVDKARSQLVSSRSEFERSSKVYDEGMIQWSDKERSFVSDVIQSKESLKGRMKTDWTVSGGSSSNTSWILTDILL
jgi:kinesin family member 11